MSKVFKIKDLNKDNLKEYINLQSAVEGALDEERDAAVAERDRVYGDEPYNGRSVKSIQNTLDRIEKSEERQNKKDSKKKDKNQNVDSNTQSTSGKGNNVNAEPQLKPSSTTTEETEENYNNEIVYTANQKSNSSSAEASYHVTQKDNNGSIEINMYNSTKAKPSENMFISFESALNIPKFSIEDFVNFRLDFLLRTNDTIYSDPGFFFYRLFFDFNSDRGLLGGIVQNSEGKYEYQQNTAFQYLSNIIQSERFGQSEAPKSFNFTDTLINKRDQLISFAKTLNFVVTNCPWFIKDVTGVKKSINYNFEAPCDEKGTFNIVFNQDAIDMRVSTIFDLYKNACYDLPNQREIIPDNLRKFDISIVLFTPPIEGVNYTKKTTGLFATTQSITYANSIGSVSSIKRDNGKGMTFKIIKYVNCEFDINELSTLPDQFTSGEPFNNEIEIKVNYDRAYEYTFNKELGVFIGPDTYIELNSAAPNISRTLTEEITSKPTISSSSNQDDMEKPDNSASENNAN